MKNSARPPGITFYPDLDKTEKIIKFAQVDKRTKSKAVDRLLDIALATPEVKQKFEEGK